MKIRKTFVGNLPDNKIVNSNSTSETDTYSCKYLNKRNVIVSSEEPTTGEEVWIEKSANLFDKNGIIKNTSVDYRTGGTYGDNDSFTTNYIPVESEKTYKFNGFSSAAGSTWGAFYDNNKNYISRIDLKSFQKNVFISDSNVGYIRLGILNTYMDNFIIREANNKIHTKIDNGYEEFYNEEDTGWVPLELASDLEVVSEQKLVARRKNCIVTVMGTLKLTGVSWNKKIADLPKIFWPKQELNFVCRGIDTGEDAHIFIINNVGRLGYLSGVNKPTAGQTVMFNICATYMVD